MSAAKWQKLPAAKKRACIDGICRDYIAHQQRGGGFFNWLGRAASNVGNVIKGVATPVLKSVVIPAAKQALAKRLGGGGLYPMGYRASGGRAAKGNKGVIRYPKKSAAVKRRAQPRDPVTGKFIKRS